MSKKLHVNDTFGSSTNDDGDLITDEPLERFAILDLDSTPANLQVPSEYEPAPPYSAIDFDEKKLEDKINSEKRKLIKVEQSRCWNHGLFSCHQDIPNFILSLFCPCIVEAFVAIKMNKFGYGVILCCLTLLVYSLLQLYYILIASAFVEAEIGTLRAINDQWTHERKDGGSANSNNGTIANDGEPTTVDDKYNVSAPNDKQLIHIFLLSFQSSRFWIASQAFAVIFGILTVSRLISAFMLRNYARKLYKIGKPSDNLTDLKDAMSVSCCYTCALSQLKSTIDQMETDNSGKTHSKLERI